MLARMAICVVFWGGLLAAQQARSPYSFKGNYLGMSLAEFKTKNAGHSVWVNTGKPNAFGGQNKKYSRELPTPLCTDVVRGFPGDDDLSPIDGEVMCNVSPGAINPDARTILDGLRLEQVLYHFYRDRLYEINISFLDLQYRTMASVFSDRFGNNAKVETKTRENGFGATWSSESRTWIDGTRIAFVVEGAGNGPAQNNLNPGSYASIIDTALEPHRNKVITPNF